MLDLIQVSDEVATALEEERAVVALETTLVAHGFPAPDGVEVARESETAVRATGAVPATIGVLGARVRIGLTTAELERFTPEARKLGPRDLAVCATQGALGATTVGGTLVAAAAVGIRFMGTGGLGGVHRGFPDPPDVSADLGACARIAAMVVSSGVKSLLDVAATLEVLETLGHPRARLRRRHGAALLRRHWWPTGVRSCGHPGRGSSGRRRPLAPRWQFAARDQAAP